MNPRHIHPAAVMHHKPKLEQPTRAPNTATSHALPLYLGKQVTKVFTKSVAYSIR